jgi:hypothetical protein
VVEFYDEDWSFLGTKAKLAYQIESITRIERQFLFNRKAINNASVGKKMSWAARRQTTRIEDMAYCLLGLVQVNMPMLYGEGDRAFQRLQLEIISKTNEHSIFAWDPSPSEHLPTTAVLAPSPSYFESVREIWPATSRKPLEARSHEITNNGLRITLPIIPIGQNRVIGLLDCRTKDEATVGIWLEQTDDGRYQRLSDSRLTTATDVDAEDADLMSMYLIVEDARPESTDNAKTQVIFREILTDRTTQIYSMMISSAGFRTAVTNKHASVHQGIDESKGPAIMGSRRHVQYLMRYLLEELILGEGDETYIQLVVTGVRSIFVAVKLSNGRPRMSMSTEQEPAIFIGDTPGSSPDSLADATGFVWRLFDTIMVQMDARKKMKDGKLQWAIFMKVFECTCGVPLGMRTECICDMWYLKGSRLGRAGPDGVTCQGLVCSSCKQLVLRPPGCVCLICKPDADFEQRIRDSVCDKCKRLVQNGSGLHYLECPCSVCEQESKSECFRSYAGLQEAESRKEQGLLPWLKHVQKNLGRRKLSAEF